MAIKKLPLCCFFAFCIGAPNAYTQKTMANLDNTMVLLDDSVSVSQTCQKHSTLSRCQCCIVDSMVKLKTWQYTDKAASVEKIFGKCSERELCTPQTLEDFKRHVQNQVRKEYPLMPHPDHREELIAIHNYLSKHHLPIKEIKANPSEIITVGGRDGILTEQGVTKILTTLCKDNLLEECPIEANCITVEDVMHGRGWATDQLFKVTTTCNHERSAYIVKGIPKVSEAFALHAMNFLPFKEIIWPNVEKGLPILANPLSYIKYYYGGSTGVEKSRYLTVLPFAPGRVFLDFIKDYLDDPTEKNFQDTLRMFEVHGKTLATFHKKYAKNDCAAGVYPHLDLHAKNIFYDEEDEQITYIDNDNLGKWAARERFPTFLNDFRENFWTGDSNELNYPVKDMIIIWNTIQRSDFLPAALEDKKLIKGTIKAFIKGYREGWGNKADCVMATIAGKSSCLDRLLEQFTPTCPN